MTIEALINDIPLFSSLPNHLGTSHTSFVLPQAIPLHNVTCIGDNKHYIGRQWEVRQLLALLTITLEEKQGTTGYISGMAGLGKSSILHAFLTDVQAIGGQCIVAEAGFTTTQYELLPLQCLGRQLLGVPLNADDEMICCRVAKLTSLSGVYTLMLWLTGVSRTDTQREELNALSEVELIQLLNLTMATLIDQCIARAVFCLIIDDLHLGSPEFIQVIKVLTTVIIGQPILMLLGATNIGQFSALPCWLEHARVIALRPLNAIDTYTLLENFLSETTIDLADQQEVKRMIIRRAYGHPRILRQLLYTPSPLNSIPYLLLHSVEVQLNNLCVDNILGVRIAASFGYHFCVEQVHFSLTQLGKSLVNCDLQSWVGVGLVKHAGAEYCFQHPMIREVILEQTNELQQTQFKSLNDVWRHSGQQDLATVAVSK
jgi:hypothetical protein